MPVVGQLDQGFLQRHHNTAPDRTIQTCMIINNGTLVQKGGKKEAESCS